MWRPPARRSFRERPDAYFLAVVPNGEAPSGDLGISVVTFTICAIITIGLILVRRSMGRQERGGNKSFAIASACPLLLLWFVYIAVSCLATYGFLGESRR